MGRLLFFSSDPHRTSAISCTIYLFLFFFSNLQWRSVLFSNFSQRDLLFVFVSHQNTSRFFQKLSQTSAFNSWCLVYAFVSGFLKGNWEDPACTHLDCRNWLYELWFSAFLNKIRNTPFGFFVFARGFALKTRIGRGRIMSICVHLHALCL